ncbi:hypothetical protein LAZ67_3005570, partial [Cordylochernes scorpioides]
MMYKFKALGCFMSIKLHFLHSHVDPFHSAKNRVKGSIKTSKIWSSNKKEDKTCLPTTRVAAKQEVLRIHVACAGVKFRPRDCSETIPCQSVASGVREIWPLAGESHKVYCDMETDGGGWTVFQRRGQFNNPQDYFYRNWTDYRRGFGNLEKEFWLGNEIIYQLTSKDNWELRVDMKAKDGESAFSTYQDFWMSDESDKYRLHLSLYLGGTGGDSLTGHNNLQFTTRDCQNDKNGAGANCALIFKGGWWYNACHSSNLNGLNLNGPHESYADGIEWYTFKQHHNSLVWTEMKIRPINRC